MTEYVVSIAKESVSGERRVIVLPQQVGQFVNCGYRVLVESGAGEGIGYSDRDYEQSGAVIASKDIIWTHSNCILKYKPPTPTEYKYLRPGISVGAIFHAEGNPVLIEILLRNKVTAYSYEFFRNADGTFPLAVAGGEIAGKLAVIYGAYHLQSHLGGRGVLLSHVVGSSPLKVLVIGCGNAGGAAARLASAMGAEVTVLGRNVHRLRHFESTCEGRVRVAVNEPHILAESVRDADLIIGAILISTYDTPAMIDDAMVSTMKAGSVIVDVTCGYGSGYMPSFKDHTSLEEPFYIRHGVIHIKIDNLPAAVPITTASAYTKVAAPYLKVLADMAHGGAEDPVIIAGRITHDGEATHDVIKKHMEFYVRQ